MSRGVLRRGQLPPVRRRVLAPVPVSDTSWFNVHFSDKTSDIEAAAALASFEAAIKSRQATSMQKEALGLDNWALLNRMRAAYVGLIAAVERGDATTGRDIARVRTPDEPVLDPWFPLFEEDEPKAGTPTEPVVLRTSPPSLCNQLGNWKSAVDAQVQKLSAWLGCRTVVMPHIAPPLAGLDLVSRRMTAWLAQPLVAVAGAAPPTTRHMALYGPASTGKSIVIRKVMFDLGSELWKRAGGGAARKPEDYVVALHVDCRLIRAAASVDDAIRRLRSALDCAQFMAQAKMDHRRADRAVAACSETSSTVASGQASGKLPATLALLALDDFDVLFLDDDALAARWESVGSRPPRDVQVGESKLTKVHADAVTKKGVFADEFPKTGGAAPDAPTTDPRTLDLRALDVALQRELGGDALSHRWPAVRVIYTMRQPWAPSVPIRALFDRRKLMLDLPSPVVRRSFCALVLRGMWLRNFLRKLHADGYRYMLDLEQMDRALASARGVDRDMLLADRRLTALVRYMFNPDLTIKPNERDALLQDKTPPQVGGDGGGAVQADQELVDRTRILLREWRAVSPPEWRGVDVLVAFMRRLAPKAFLQIERLFASAAAPAVEAAARGSGMSLAGYCALESAGLDREPIESFLAQSGRDGDLEGRTDFGFNMDDLTHFLGALTRRVARLQWQAAVDERQAFVRGGSAVSAGCRLTARDVSTALDAGDQERKADYVNPLESDTCGAMFDHQLNGTALTGAAGVKATASQHLQFPWYVRYGSHRATVAHVFAELNAFEPRVTPKPDYGQYVFYALFDAPAPPGPASANRRLSSICTARPGPLATLIAQRDGSTRVGGLATRPAQRRRGSGRSGRLFTYD